MIFTNKCSEDVEEVTILMNDFKISEYHANEIINIYFEHFNSISYLDFLRQQIRVIKKEDNQDIIEQLEKYDDACAFMGDDYILITNYETIHQKLKITIGDEDE